MWQVGCFVPIIQLGRLYYIATAQTWNVLIIWLMHTRMYICTHVHTHTHIHTCTNTYWYKLHINIQYIYNWYLLMTKTFGIVIMRVYLMLMTFSLHPSHLYINKDRHHIKLPTSVIFTHATQTSTLFPEDLTNKFWASSSTSVLNTAEMQDSKWTTLPCIVVVI